MPRSRPSRSTWARHRSNRSPGCCRRRAIRARRHDAGGADRARLDRSRAPRASPELPPDHVPPDDHRRRPRPPNHHCRRSPGRCGSSSPATRRRARRAPGCSHGRPPTPNWPRSRSSAPRAADSCAAASAARLASKPAPDDCDRWLDDELPGTGRRAATGRRDDDGHDAGTSSTTAGTAARVTPARPRVRAAPRDRLRGDHRRTARARRGLDRVGRSRRSRTSAGRPRAPARRIRLATPCLRRVIDGVAGVAARPRRCRRSRADGSTRPVGRPIHEVRPDGVHFEPTASVAIADDFLGERLIRIAVGA